MTTKKPMSDVWETSQEYTSAWWYFGLRRKLPPGRMDDFIEKQFIESPEYINYRALFNKRTKEILHLKIEYAYVIFCDDNNLDRINDSDARRLVNFKMMRMAIDAEIARCEQGH